MSIIIDPVTLYKCLADKTRLTCMLLIEHEKELCVCELTEALMESQPKVSRHLAQLKKCGLLADRRHGQWVYYRINEGLPEWVRTELTHVCLANQSFYKINLKKLQNMGNRPLRCVKKEET